MLKQNLISNFFSNGWTVFMGLAFIPLYIKFLGIESYALIGVFGVLQTFFGLLDMGMTQSLSREMARFSGGLHTVSSIRDVLRSIEIVVAGLSLLIIVAVLANSTWLATSWLNAGDLPIQEVTQAITIMGFVIALRFLEGVYRSALIGLQRQVLLNIFNVVISTVRSFGSIAVLIWVSPSIKNFFFWQGIIAFISIGFLFLVTYSSFPKSDIRGKFSLKSLRGIWKFAGGMSIITALAVLLTTIDKVLLSRFLSLSDFGYYTLASVVAGALYLMVNPITLAWFPRLCQLHAASNANGLVRAYHLGAQLVSVVVGSAALLMMVNAETLLQLWTQDPSLASQTAPLLSILLLGNLLNILMWMPYQLQLAFGWTSLAVWGNTFAVIMIVPAIIWVVPEYGAIGAAWVWVILNACYCLFSIHFMFRRILQGEKWLWYRYDVLEPIFAAGCMAVLLKLSLPSPTSDLARVGSLLCATIVTLISATLASKQLKQSLKELYLKL